jgi:hypothetical protein
MKLNINNGEINGYLNTNDPGMVDNASATEILCPNSNAIHCKNIKQFLDVCWSKLRLNGKFVLGGLDIVEFAKLVIRYELSAEQKNEIIANSGNLLSLDEMVTLCKEAGFTIKKKQLDGMKFLLEMTRENPA